LTTFTSQAKQAIGAMVCSIRYILHFIVCLSLLGMVGEGTNYVLHTLFGAGAYLAPFVCGFYVYALLNPKDDERVSTSKIVGIALLFITALAFLELSKEGAGGYAGLMIEAPLYYLMKGPATGVFLGAILLIGVFLTFNIGLQLPSFFKKKEVEELSDDIDQLKIPEDVENDDAQEQVAEETPKEATPTKKPKNMAQKLGIGTDAEFLVSNFVGTYAPPPLSLLSKDSKGKAKNW